MPATYTDPKPETRKIVSEYIGKGRDGNWLWSNLVQDICKSEELDCGERGKEVGENAAKILRGIYPGRESIWDATFKNKSPADLDIVYDHIIGIAVMEAHFTITRRPVPPKPEPKPKKEPSDVPPPPEGEGGSKKGKKKANPDAPPPPAPAPAPAAPPPPPAG